jgi:hypothetical protein
MTSFVTTDCKNVLFDLFRQDIEDTSTSLYLGISSADSSSGGLYGQNQARNEMNFVKVISSKSFVLDNYTWTSGVVYNAYDDNDLNQTQFYVVNSTNQVFLCIQTAKDTDGTKLGSTVQPTTTLATEYDSIRKSFRTSDNYIWRYLYTLTAASTNNFKTISYIPVQKIYNSSLISEELQQKNLQDNATAGEILSIAIDSGGTGYNFAPRIDIFGNGSGASFTATIDNGRIVRITADSDVSGIAHGSGYDYAQVVVSSGDASLRAVLGPRKGVNEDPVQTLRADKFMINTEIQDDESGAIPLADPTNDFKQVMLIRNPLVFGTTADSAFTANAGNAMNYLEIENVGNGPFTADQIIENSTFTAQAKVYWHDTVSTPERLYYTQNHTTGFGDFIAGQSINSTTQSPQCTANITGTGLKDPDVDRYSGQILYINNLETAIDRTSTQTEDIKIVIDLGQEG